MKAANSGPLIRPVSLFGNPTRTRILMALALIAESYPRELSRLVGTSLSVVQKAIDRLESEGVVATRRIGVERRVTLNPTFVTAQPLRDLLFDLAQTDPALVDAIRKTRKRPRRRTKPL